MAYSLKITMLLFLLAFSLFNCTSDKESRVENHLGISEPIENLDCCDNFGTDLLELAPGKEVVILVHGCKASSDHFSTLRDVFKLRGQQAICFSYDYRESIEDCSRELLRSINSLNQHLNPSQITVLGHSQGGLVARRALISNREDSYRIEDADLEIKLVTISSPFNGIIASSHCGLNNLHILSGGITLLICQAAAGSTWSEINPYSDFINQPGILSDNVYEHIKINTDEQDTCRRVDDNGICLESDYVFSLEEQYSEAVDQDTRVINVEIKAGHAQVIGKPGAPPLDLMHVLEKYRVLNERTVLGYLEEQAMLNDFY